MSVRRVWRGGAVVVLAAFVSSASFVGSLAGPRAPSGEPSSPCNRGKPDGFQYQSTIAFSTNRDNPNLNLINGAEIYLMNPDGSNPRRLTNNAAGDGFAALAPDGKRVVFDSNRDRAAGEPLNTSDLYLMNADGSEQTHLTRGSSASWSPDCKNIAFHASASGTGTPIKTDPGAATTDSDIFVANVDDLVAGTAVPRNITNGDTDDLGQPLIDDDPDWSPDGQSIVYTAHPNTDNAQQSNQAEIYVINPDGTGTPHRLTNNTEEERAPDWSPDGKRIEYMCRIGGGSADFELCVMNADGTDQHALTDNTVQDLSANWSPDGQHLIFHRPVAGPGTFQLFVINADGTEDPATAGHPLIFPFPPGINSFPDWGLLRVKDQG